MKRTILTTLATVAAATLLVAGPAHAAKPAPQPAKPTGNTSASAYLGHWANAALVYDATGGNNTFKVAEAVSEWRKSGWNVAVTTDPAKANITVKAETPMTGAIGDASLAKTGDVITGCTVRLEPVLLQMATVGEHTAIHELGHCGGLPHSTSTKSVMYESTNSNTALTAPTAADLRWMAGNVTLK